MVLLDILGSCPFAQEEGLTWMCMGEKNSAARSSWHARNSSLHSRLHCGQTNQAGASVVHLPTRTIVTIVHEYNVKILFASFDALSTLENCQSRGPPSIRLTLSRVVCLNRKPFQDVGGTGIQQRTHFSGEKQLFCPPPAATSGDPGSLQPLAWLVGALAFGKTADTENDENGRLSCARMPRLSPRDGASVEGRHMPRMTKRRLGSGSIGPLRTLPERPRPETSCEAIPHLWGAKLLALARRLSTRKSPDAVWAKFVQCHIRNICTIVFV